MHFVVPALIVAAVALVYLLNDHGLFGVKGKEFRVYFTRQKQNILFLQGIIGQNPCDKAFGVTEVEPLPLCQDQVPLPGEPSGLYVFN